MLRAADLWTSFSEAALDAVFPPKCPLCGLLSPSSPCPACRSEFRPNDPEWRVRGDGLLDGRIALFYYEGRAAQAVRRLKYGRSSSLARTMASDVAQAVSRLGIEYDLVVPVPIHWSRRCARGFNQAELLSEALGWTPGMLRRVRRTRPQVGLSREERERNLAGAFEASPEVAGKRALLIDDVLTSGQTALECARALRLAGATEVSIVAYCGEP